MSDSRQKKTEKERQKNVSISLHNVGIFVPRSASLKFWAQKKCYAVNRAEQFFEKIFSKTRNGKYLHKILMLL